ncbi:MAG: Ig-like domain-containing protein [Deltaproteobacteria bacterium]|nr:Ig-like domain-containing protein [Deltaproteobacteria bacterium]
MTTAKSLLVFVAVCFVSACGQEVKMIEVQPANISFSQFDQSMPIKATAQASNGKPVEGVAFTYRSENEGVVTVSAGGLVKPVRDGSAAVIVEGPSGVRTEVFVKVCLPKTLTCKPLDQLELQVGVAGPITCRIFDCKENKVEGTIEYAIANPAIAQQDANYKEIFTGLMIGDTEITAKAYGIETKIKVHVTEGVNLPGMGGGGGGGGKKPADEGSGDGYPKGGRYDHILKNMKVNPD